MHLLRKSIYGMCFLLAASAVPAQDWEFGIGTGFYGLNFDGDGGFNTVLSGPIVYEVDLDSSDTQDLLESAFGLGGYARNGRWTITWNFGQLELEDDVPAVVGGTLGNLDATFTKTDAKLALEYQFAQLGEHRWGILGGFRYTKHEWEGDFDVAGVPTASGKLDENWTDFIVGITHAYPLSQSFIWSSRLDYGGGDSEGTVFFDTGLTWRFADSWTARLYGSITQHDFEEGDIGDPDFFFYDTDEFGAGISILYHF